MPMPCSPTITLSGVLVVSVDLAQHQGSEKILEDVTLNFTKATFEYKEQKADGSLSGTVAGGYDVNLNKKV